MSRSTVWFVVLALPGMLWAQSGGDAAIPPISITPVSPILPTAIAPISPALKPIPRAKESKPEGVKWGDLLQHSFRFLVFEHAFRYATEPGTRHPGMPFFQGYVDSVSALHGWSDGDPFYVNYLGHPMQGAVTGYLWTISDTRYRNVEFGRNPDYWKSRLRAGAFAWAYSTQMEIGPISEASIGHIQAVEPKQVGFVDHVVTPAVGMAWMIGEDALDKYLVRWVEGKTTNRYVRILVRGGANPSRSFANIFAGKYPWSRPRDDIRYLLSSGPTVSFIKKVPRAQAEKNEDYLKPGVAPFDFGAHVFTYAASGGPCVGGGASVAFRVQSQWQIVGDVNGCTMTSLSRPFSGDLLSYMAGPRWTLPTSGRLVPYWQILVGGNKASQELRLPALPAPTNSLVVPEEQIQRSDESGFALAGGMGLDLRLNRVVAVRLVGVEYTRSWMKDMNNFAAPNGLQLKMGVVLHSGTW